jgi:hypothetical protein
MDVFDQVQFGLGRADHQNLLRTFQGVHDGVKVVLVHGLSSRTHVAAFGVQVGVWLGGVDPGGLDVVGRNVHDMGFRMVQPDDCVKVGHESLCCLIRAQLRRIGPGHID